VTVTRRLGREWPKGRLGRCIIAALAELHKVMKRAKAKTVLIVTCSIALQPELMCAPAATAPSCSGYTIDQIGGIMGICRAVRDVATSSPLLVRMHQT
jgi:hypothetical protein